jgi:hypothetical protein
VLGRVDQRASKVLMLWRFSFGVLSLSPSSCKPSSASSRSRSPVCASPSASVPFGGTYAVVPVLETVPGTVVAGGHAMLAGMERHECVRLKTHENRRS